MKTGMGFTGMGMDSRKCLKHDSDMIETKPTIKMQPWTAVSSWLAVVNQTLTDLASIDYFLLLHRADERQPARNSCPRFRLYQVAVVLKARKGGGGVLPKKMNRGVHPASQNPYPIYDLTKNLIPYL